MLSFNQEKFNLKSHDLFLTEWKNSFSGNFNLDGPLTQSYFSSSMRLLFLLKETNGTKENIDIRESILNSLDNKKSKWSHGRSSVLRRVGLWSQGILNYDDNITYENARKKRLERLVFEKIAYINIMKSSGKNRTSDKKLSEFVQSHKTEIKQQIELLKPNIVICGGTFSVVKNHIFCSMEKISDELFWADGIFFIKSCHPAYFGEKERVVYQRIIKNFEIYKQCVI